MLKNLPLHLKTRPPEHPTLEGVAAVAATLFAGISLVIILTVASCPSKTCWSSASSAVKDMKDMKNQSRLVGIAK